MIILPDHKIFYVKRKNRSWLSSALRRSEVWSGKGVNRVISTREIYGGSSFVAVIHSRRHNERPLRRLLFVIILRPPSPSADWLPFWPSSFHSQPFNQKPLMKSLIAGAEQSYRSPGENSPNYTWAGRWCPWMSPTKLFPWIRSSPRSLSSNATRCSCARCDNAFFLFSSLSAFSLFFYFYFIFSPFSPEREKR